MRLLVTGKNGQLASALAQCAPDGIDIIQLGRPECDLAQPEALGAHLQGLRCDLLVNAAAYTAVDRAEAEPETAFAVNAAAPAILAAAAARAGMPMIQISTDFVFDGHSSQPYREEDKTAPLSVYGQSKLAGEEETARENPRHLILRTAWVYSHHGQNFLRTMLRLAAANAEIKVVADQCGCPTYAVDLARAILELAPAMCAWNEADPRFGLYHLAGSGDTSRAGFAEAIFSASAALGGPRALVRPVASTAFPAPARRPANSRLDCSRAASVLGLRLPFWADGVARCVARLKQDDQLGATS